MSHPSMASTTGFLIHAPAARFLRSIPSVPFRYLSKAYSIPRVGRFVSDEYEPNVTAARLPNGMLRFILQFVSMSAVKPLLYLPSLISGKVFICLYSEWLIGFWNNLQYRVLLLYPLHNKSLYCSLLLSPRKACKHRARLSTFFLNRSPLFALNPSVRKSIAASYSFTVATINCPSSLNILPRFAKWGDSTFSFLMESPKAIHRSRSEC